MSGLSLAADGVSGHPVSDHFVDVNKMVGLGSGSQREVDDFMLTRYACYLIAQNGDSRRSEIAFAQTCFAVQTCKAESTTVPYVRRSSAVVFTPKVCRLTKT